MSNKIEVFEKIDGQYTIEVTLENGVKRNFGAPDEVQAVAFANGIKTGFDVAKQLFNVINVSVTNLTPAERKLAGLPAKD